MQTIFWVILAVLWLATLWLLRRREARTPTSRTLSTDFLAGGILLLLTITFFWRTISGAVYQPADGGDLVSFLYPTYRYAATQISQWTLPLWNPHLYAGAPFIGDIQAGFLYPPNLLLFWLNPNFDYQWMQWLAIGHLYWAGLGVYVLIRSLSLGADRPTPYSALFGALAFQCSDALLIHQGNLNLIAVLSWLPWVLAAFGRALEQGKWRWAGIAGLLFAIGNYAGHAQSSLYIGLALGIYWILRAVSADNRRGGILYNLLALFPQLLVTILITFLLTAPILLPAIELSGYTERSEFTYQDTVAYSLSPAQAAIGFLTPGFFGRGPQLHWGLWPRVETPYIGVAALLLAIGALLLADGKQRRQLLPWIGLALFGLLVSLGIYGLLHGLLTWIVPGFNQLRAPARAIVLWALGAAVLSAHGVEWLTKRAKEIPTQFATFLKWGAILLFFVSIPIFYAGLLATQNNPDTFLRASLAVLAVLFAAGFWLATWVLILADQRGWIGERSLAVALIALLFLDLSATGSYIDISPSDPTKGFQHPELIAFLKNDPDLFRIDTRTDIQQFWQPDTAALAGLQDVGGIVNPLSLRQWKIMWEATGGRQSQTYDMLNVKYVIVKDGTPLPGEGKFELVFDAPGELALYRNRDFLPRAWLSSDSKTGLPANLPAVRFRHYGANEMTMQVSAPQELTLVLSELWYPGWQATVNGVVTAVEQTELGLRRVAVPKGEAEVKLWFAPSSWRWGLGLFGVGVVMLLFVSIRKSRPVCAII